jgi:hypothetical protein
MCQCAPSILRDITNAVSCLFKLAGMKKFAVFRQSNVCAVHTKRGSGPFRVCRSATWEFGGQCRNYFSCQKVLFASVSMEEA